MREMTTRRSRPYRVTVYHCCNFTFGAQLPFFGPHMRRKTEDGRKTGGREETGGDGRWTGGRKTDGQTDGRTDDHHRPHSYLVAIACSICAVLVRTTEGCRRTEDEDIVLQTEACDWLAMKELSHLHPQFCNSTQVKESFCQLSRRNTHPGHIMWSLVICWSFCLRCVF